MDRERLYEILDIEEPAEFDYFENIAALLECDENIGYEELYGLLQEVSMKAPWYTAERTGILLQMITIITVRSFLPERLPEI